MRFGLLFLAVAVVTASVVPLVRREEWWIRIFDFPRVQLLAAGLLVLLGLVFFWRAAGWIDLLVIAALIAALALQAKRILPYTPVGSKEVLDAAAPETPDTVSLLIANVQMENRNAARLLEIIDAADPDVVLVLEPDQWWMERLAVLRGRYPYATGRPLPNRYGIALFSRHELIEPRIECLVSDDVPSIHTRLRLASGAEVRLHGVHPEPPAPTEAKDTVERDAELLIVGRAVQRREACPTVVAGDLNDVAWSHTTGLFQRISGLLDPRKGRGLFNSYHARLPLLRWPLDHAFHSVHFTLGQMARLPAFGSDHFPILVRLVLEPAAPELQSQPEADAEDLTRVEHKLNKVRE